MRKFQTLKKKTMVAWRMLTDIDVIIDPDIKKNRSITTKLIF